MSASRGRIDSAPVTLLLRVLAVLIACCVPSTALAAGTWLPPVALSDADTAQPDVAAGAGGDVLVAWKASDGVTAAFRPAGGGFATQVLAPGGFGERVAFDPSGNALALWNAGGQVMAAFRPAGGSFAAAVQISDARAGQIASAPELVFDAAGNAVAVWLLNNAGEGLIQAAFRPAGGVFGPPQTISAAGQSATGQRLAVDPQGNVLAVWRRSDGSRIWIEAAFRPVGGSFAPAVPISEAGQDATQAQVTFDDAGNALAAWLRFDGARWRAQAAFRPAGGAFGPAQTLSEAGQDASTPAIAVDAQGNALATWEMHFWIFSAFRPAGGRFGEPVRVSAIDHNAIGAQIAFDGDGDAVAVWWDRDGAETFAAAAVRPAGGTFAPPQKISAAGVEQLSPRLAIDGEGNAVAVWRRSEGSATRAEAAGYDAVAPVLRSVLFPAGGSMGTALAFSAEPFDVWGPVTTTWEFGDGGGATGAQVAHAYGASGTFAARVTATDAAGNVVGATGPVLVAPTASAGSVGAAPVLSRLTISPSRFRAAACGPSVAVATGTTIAYRLSEPARVRFTVRRATVGRRAGAACRRPTPRNRTHARCTRYVAVRGSFAHSGRAGANTLRFTGRVRRRSLAPGRYRLLASATDTAGKRSRQRHSAFRILRR